MTQLEISARAARASILVLGVMTSLAPAHASTDQTPPPATCAGLILNDRSDDAALQRDILGRFEKPAQWTLRVLERSPGDGGPVRTRLRATNAHHPDCAVDVAVEHPAGGAPRVVFEPLPATPSAARLDNARIASPLGETLAPAARARAAAFWGLRVGEGPAHVRLRRSRMPPGHSVIYLEFEVDGRLIAGDERTVTRPVVFAVHPNRRVEAIF